MKSRISFLIKSCNMLSVYSPSDFHISCPYDTDDFSGSVHEPCPADHFSHRRILADCRNHSYPGILEDRTMNVFSVSITLAGQARQAEPTNKNWSLGHSDLHTNVYSQLFTF